MNKTRAVFALILSAVAMQAATKMTSGDFGKTREGTPVRIYTLTNASGVEAAITNYGGRIVSLKVPDRKGAMGDVVAGFTTLDGYLGDESLLRRDGGALCESDRTRAVQVEWRGLHAGEK